MCKQIRSLAEISNRCMPVLANAGAILYEGMDDLNWAGFYIVRDGVLVLGPFNGKPACIRIEKGSGVCGNCWKDDETKRVADVHLFSGHIACDAASLSDDLLEVGEVVVEQYDVGAGFCRLREYLILRMW